MNSEDRELVKRLNKSVAMLDRIDFAQIDVSLVFEDVCDAATRLESLCGEVERLRDANAITHAWIENRRKALSKVGIVHGPAVAALEFLEFDLRAALSPSDGDSGEKPNPPGPVNCTHVLRREGKAYPRTCERCGLGPCPFYDKDGRPLLPASPENSLP